MKKYEGNTIANVTTKTGKLPDNVGFSRSSGVTRSLTKQEIKLQKDLQKSNIRF